MIYASRRHQSLILDRVVEDARLRRGGGVVTRMGIYSECVLFSENVYPVHNS